MKTIKSKILSPFLILIVLLPIITLLIFNICINIYVRNIAKEELENTAQTMNELIKKELITDALDTDTQQLDNVILKLNGALKASKLALNTELLLFDRNGNLIYPRKNMDSSSLSNEAIQIIYDNVLENKKGDVKALRVAGNKYLMLSENIAKQPIKREVKLVFLTSLSSANGLITTLNTILFVIMLFFIGIGIVVANIISNTISKPVVTLSKITEKIGEGDFDTLKNKTQISELNKLENSISLMSQKLYAYDMAQKAFLQNASHELRTPLMSIQGYSEGIEKGILTDTKKAASIINNESKRLNVLVDQLLILSRIENQTYAKTLEKINLCNVLKEYHQSLEGIAIKEQKKIELILPEISVFVLADDNLLSQAIINIASNCIRYAKETVQIHLSQQSGKITIKISDDGNGISENDLPHIFERFYKGENGNLGLGLAIAKSAIEFLGGKIVAYNGVSGAVFNIELRALK